MIQILKKHWKEFLFIFLGLWLLVSTVRLHVVLEKAAIRRDKEINQKQLEIKKNPGEINI